MVDDACLLFALGRESQAFLRQFPPRHAFPQAPCPTRVCGSSSRTVLVLETGVGRSRTEAALSWLLDQPASASGPSRPRLVLSTGFAGALQPDVAVGDVVLATEVADLHGTRWPATWPCELPAGRVPPTLHRGRLISTPHLVGLPEEKQALGKRHGALAADMETATVARRCSERGVPFGCVRAISDDVRTGLSPRVLSLVAGERVSLPRVLMALATTPRLAAELWRLARHTRHAAQQLSIVLGELVVANRTPDAAAGRPGHTGPGTMTRTEAR